MNQPPRDALPSPPSGFAWRQEPFGPLLHCVPLVERAPHFFTTRHLPGAIGEPGGEGWRRIASAIGVEPGALVRLRQVHGAGVVALGPGERLPPGPLPGADVLATSDPGLALSVRVADCVPVLLADERTGAVAAAHAGWRGTAAGAAAAAVRTLAARFGSRSADVMAALGPSIGPCCYEVGVEVADAFRAAGHGRRRLDRWFVSRDGRLVLDLWRATADQLVDEGLDASRVHTAGLCTAGHAGTFCSFRAEGSAAGRMVAVIRPPGRT